jgi:Flp pilus assembly protein TadG
MQQYSPKPVPGSFRARFSEALGRGPRSLQNDGHRHHERGNAVVEFTLLLMVPLVYFIITMGQIQGGSFAVVGAADQGAKVYIAQPDAATAQAAAEQAVVIALADFGHPREAARVKTSCDPADCQAAGSTVTVRVRLTVPLPFLPFSDDFRLSASEVEASSTQIVGRYR